MATVKCPVCSCDVSGRDSYEISSALRAHMTESHELGDDKERIKGGMERLPSSLAEPGGELKEEPQGSATYDEEFALRGDALYGTLGPPSHAALALRCPVCDEEVCGKDEDELSRHLREHVREGHGIKEIKKGT